MAVMSEDLERIYSAYENRLIRRKASATALREFRNTTSRWLEFLAARGLGIEDIRGVHVEEFFAATGWSPATQAARLTYLRAPWLYGQDEDMGVPPRNPFKRVELERPGKREPVTATNSELRMVKAACRNVEDWVLFHLFAYTGFRAMEVQQLMWDDVSFSEGTIHTIGKGNKERTIPLHPALHEALHEMGRYYKGSPYVLSNPRQGMLTDTALWQRTKVLAARGGQDISPHTYRRTLTTSLMVNGAHLYAVKRLLGHSKTRDVTEDHYSALSMAFLRNELLKAYADDPL